MNLPRTLEPKTLCPHDEAAQYKAMDHRTVNLRFVDDLCAAGPVGPQVIDLGCGPAAIPIALCQKLAEIELLAVDADVEMLEIAKRDIDVATLLDRVTLHQADVNAMDDYEDEMADTLISNSLLHHLDEPALGLQTALRLAKRGGRLFLRDLVRPETLERTEELVTTYTEGETTIAQQLFRQSLLASLTVEEIRTIAGGLGISSDHVQMTSDRHWTIDWCRPD